MNWYKKALKEYEKVKEGEYYLTDWPSRKIDLEPYDYPSKWMPVESSFISHVAYFEPLGIFEIKTKDGQEYSFKGVPEKVFKQFMNAKSKGEFFNKVIKKKYGAKN